MFNNLGRLSGSTVTATDGPMGHVKAAYFDDNTWTIRYLVVDTGSWLSERDVLISPYAVEQRVDSGTNINVALTRAQVRASPDIDTHQPVSRQHERQYLDYYGYPDYWEGGGLWGLGAYPLIPPYVPTPTDIEAASAMRERDQRAADVHLRSSTSVKGYDIQASDGSIGHVQDFVFDAASWAIRYLVVDTRNWWPGGKHVLIATPWIDSIDWSTRTVRVTLTRQQVKNSPDYVQAPDIGRDDEKRLHDAYSRQGYWAPDQQDDSATPGVAHAMSHPAARIDPPEQEVCHGAEQSAVPAGSVDARVLRAVRLGAAVRGSGANMALAPGLCLPAVWWRSRPQRVPAT